MPSGSNRRGRKNSSSGCPVLACSAADSMKVAPVLYENLPPGSSVSSLVRNADTQSFSPKIKSALSLCPVHIDSRWRSVIRFILSEMSSFAAYSGKNDTTLSSGESRPSCTANNIAVEVKLLLKLYITCVYSAR